MCNECNYWKEKWRVINEHDNMMRRHNCELGHHNLCLKLENDKLREILLQFMTLEEIEKDLDDSIFFRKYFHIDIEGDEK